MYVLAGVVIGLIWGDWKARKRGGNKLDRAQYAAVHAIGLALVGLFVTVIINRIWA
ncbi:MULTISPECIES: hypothetical protein [Thioclava]|uniref:Acyltransferase n=1 Tax=Thioclava electrotropha TaxID=1549850 RepID=A0ABX6YU78_9RHOB|nr:MULTISPECIES: hypothetical protein [Thioclava]PFG63487.1 hypothetical protein AXZ77_2094 [Thioclava sp. ES.031]QPZ91389.1 hypothetical protein AKL02_011085 [Thioclava electrotropha]WGT50001.1 hypothetical protein P0N61_17080 [Thioclava nitratireducens]|tara:strand:- start:182 stop:349 length:168 start_codon:yes stop_codon:yes gene_type:complete